MPRCYRWLRRCVCAGLDCFFSVTDPLPQNKAVGEQGGVNWDRTVVGEHLVRWLGGELRREGGIGAELG